MTLGLAVEILTRKAREQGFVAGLALLLAVQLTSASLAQDSIDPVTGFVREPVHVAAWPGGKRSPSASHCSSKSSGWVRVRCSGRISRPATRIS